MVCASRAGKDIGTRLYDLRLRSKVLPMARRPSGTVDMGYFDNGTR
jgi:hypothetical protein